MPPAPCVAADVPRSPRSTTAAHPQHDPKLSPFGGTRRTFRSKRRPPPPSPDHHHPQPTSRHLPTWQPSQQSPSPQGSPAPPPSAPYPAAQLRHAGPSTFSLRDQAVEKFEAGLHKQGSLSSNGLMSAPRHLHHKQVPPRVPALTMQQLPSLNDPFTPTTPAFYPSPTSPATSSIPFTPSLPPQDSWHPKAPSIYPHTAYSGSQRSPYMRKRSATTSSVPSPVRLSPVTLPIGKRTPKWREEYQEPSCNPIYPNYPHQESTEPSPSGFRRLGRSPAGPRPMTSRTPSNSTGLGFDMPDELGLRQSPYRGYTGAPLRRSPSYDFDSDLDSAHGPLDDDDGRSISQFSYDQSVLEHARFDRSGRQDEGQPQARRSRDQAVHQSEMAGDTVEDVEGYEGETEDAPGAVSLSGCHSSSEDDELPPRTPFTPAAWTDHRPSAEADPDAAVPPLGEPFAMQQRKSLESGERSAFDSDTEDEGDPKVKRFSRLRNALKTSMSVPSLKHRLSVFSTTGSSSLDTSPESVSHLRARQMTTTATPGRNPHILKLATDLSTLAPIPQTPAVGSPEEQTPGRSGSPPTPATPASPEARQTKSFIWEMSKAPLFLNPPPLPPMPLTVGRSIPQPPREPLPATPPSMSTPSLPLRPSHERADSFVEKWRMNVSDDPDPDASMARLEESMAKLEVYAPRTSSDTNDSSAFSRSPRPPPHVIDLPQSPASGESGSSRHPTDEAASAADKADKGVVVIAVEPRAPPRERKTHTLRGEDFLPPLPPKQPAPPRPPREGPARKPSLTLLPRFDFERPGQQGLDMRGLPLRTTSLYRRDTASDAAPSPRSPAPSASAPAIVLERITGPPRPGEPERAPTPPTPPARVSSAADGVASFMDPLTPPDPPAKPRSRVRRFLERRADLVRGLRGSFIS